MYKTVGYYSIGTSSTLPIIEPVREKKKILKSVGDWALGNMNMDMDMDTSILENILNITPSGVIVGSDTFGVVDIDMDIDIDIDEDADIDSEIDDAFST
jgi:hypothetical protein